MIICDSMLYILGHYPIDFSFFRFRILLLSNSIPNDLYTYQLKVLLDKKEIIIPGIDKAMAK